MYVYIDNVYHWIWMFCRRKNERKEKYNDILIHWKMVLTAVDIFRAEEIWFGLVQFSNCMLFFWFFFKNKTQKFANKSLRLKMNMLVLSHENHCIIGLSSFCSSFPFLLCLLACQRIGAAAAASYNFWNTKPFSFCWEVSCQFPKTLKCIVISLLRLVDFTWFGRQPLSAHSFAHMRKLTFHYCAVHMHCITRSRFQSTFIFNPYNMHNTR